MALEPNQGGVNEFTDLCKEVGVAPMMAVNLWARGAQEAAGLLQYCGVAGGSYWRTYSGVDRSCCSRRKCRCTPSVHAVISKRAGPTIRRFVEDGAYSDDLFADVSG